ncbi:MAG: hypothetical protein J5I93_05615 [Pirellulaceae bacterium]|nr:hypothetical protein [Pirellulaceae bacterium]
MLTLATRRAEVTQRLHVAMQSRRSVESGRHRLIGWLLLAITGFVAGAEVAWSWRPRSPLSLAEGETPHVERMGSAREQFCFAALEDSEPAWLSVSLYFPASESTRNAYYARRARQRLVELYRDEGRDQEALELYQQLAGLARRRGGFPAVFAGIDSLQPGS